MRFFKNNLLSFLLFKNFGNYPTPSNLNSFWNFGSLAFIFLFVQILTGVFLAMFYVPQADLAFSCMDYIMREVNFELTFTLCAC